MLIVIGNPHILVHDRHWAKLIFHCIDHGSYKGCSKPERTIDASVDKLSAVFSRLGVSTAENNNGSGEIVSNNDKAYMINRHGVILYSGLLQHVRFNVAALEKVRV